LQPDDAVIKLTKVTICGTDLGIWKEWIGSIRMERLG